MTLQSAAPKLAAGADLARWPQHLARAVSQIGSPPVLTLATSLVCANVVGTAVAWTWALVHSGIALVAPTLYVIWLVHRGDISDLHLRAREERIRPLKAFVGAHAASLAIMWAASAPSLLTLLAGLNLVQLLIFLGVTLRWKISMHCTAASGLSMLGWSLIGDGALLLGFSVPLIAWSRVYLDRHTPSQTLAGAALGTGLWVAALIAYGG
jgi:membrane-associated phospholipid phosphatase